MACDVRQMSLQPFLSVRALVLLIVANSTPVILSRTLGGHVAAPIDGGLRLQDGTAVLGAHKTWRGMVGGSLAAGVAGTLLGWGFIRSATFGALALLGDLLSSFVKRRFGLTAGRWMPLLDQLPEALLPMLVLRSRVDLTVGSIVGTAAAFTVIALAAAWVSTRNLT